MTGTKTGYAAIGALLAIGAALWWSQRQEAARLRVQVDALRAEDRDLARARAEHRRLAATAVAPQELENLRADRAALTRMRAEIDALKEEIEKAAKPPAPPKPVMQTTAAEPPPPPRKVPASEWRNAGRGTPAATVETALWAAAGGDVDALAAALTFEPKQRQIIDDFFAAIPPAMREQYGTVERLVATFTAKDIPLGSMQIMGQKAGGPDDTIVAMVLFDAEGRAKRTQLNLRRGDDGWRLLVPAAAVQNYANTIGAVNREP